MLVRDICAQLLVTAGASVGMFITGLSVGFTSPALPELRRDLALSGLEESLICCLLPLGCVCGVPPAAAALGRLGRRAALLQTGTLFFAGWMAVTYAGSAAALMAGRLVIGLGVGGALVTTPTYVGEIAGAEVRGALGVLTQVVYSVGMLLQFVVGKFVAWRWLALLSGCAAAAWLPALALLLPESPLYLVAEGREAEAAAALRRLRGPRADLAAELEGTARFAADAARRRPPLVARLRAALRPPHRRPVLTVLGLFLLVAGSGIDVLTYFTVDILTAAESALEPHTAAILAQASWLPSMLLAAALADRLGRRPLLFASTCGTAACLATLGVYFHLLDAGCDVSSVHWLPLVCLMLFNPFFAIGLGVVPWIALSEMFAPEMRGLGASVGPMSSSLAATLFTFSFDGLRKTIKEAGTFWLFAGFSAFGAFYSVFVLYETKGKTLEDISKHYKQGGHVAKSGDSGEEKEDAVTDRKVSNA